MKEERWFLYIFFCRIRDELELPLVWKQYADFGKVIVEFYDGSLDSLYNLCKTLWLMKPSAPLEERFKKLFIEEFNKELSWRIDDKESVTCTPSDINHIEDKVDDKNKPIEDFSTNKTNNLPNLEIHIQPNKSIIYLKHQDAIGSGGVRNDDTKNNNNEKRFLFFDQELPITDRAMQQSWQYQRGRLKRMTTKEMDLAATVTQCAKDSAIINPIFVKEKTNYFHVLIMVDQQGSMIPFEYFHKRIEDNLHKVISTPGGEIEKYYFHNYPCESVFTDPELNGSISLDALFKRRASHQLDLLLIISDAGALNNELDFFRINNMHDFREKCIKINPNCKILWFNPLPAHRLKSNTSSKIMASIFTTISADQSTWKKLPNVLRSNSRVFPSSQLLETDKRSEVVDVRLYDIDFMMLGDSDQLRAQVELFIKNEAKKPGIFWLATLACFFPALSANLLHKIWLNFNIYITKITQIKEPLEPIDFADLLNSSLCNPVAKGIYQIHPLIRGLFLTMLFQRKECDPNLKRDLALFLKQYNKKIGHVEFYTLALQEAIQSTFWEQLEPDLFKYYLMELLIRQDFLINNNPVLNRLLPILFANPESNSGTSNKVGSVVSLIKFLQFEQQGKEEKAIEAFQSIKEHLTIQPGSFYAPVEEKYYDLILELDFIKRVNELILNLDYSQIVAQLSRLKINKNNLYSIHYEVYLELLYLFAHTKNERIFGNLREIADYFFPDLIIDFIDTNRILNAIKKIDPQIFEKLQTRYFPTLVPVPGGQSNTGVTRQKRNPIPVINFSIADTPTTWWQYSVFLMANNKKLPELTEWHRQGNHPAVMIGWEDARDYTSWLNRNELGSNRYYLPWESEWVLAAKSGGEEEYTYAGSNKLDEVGWFKENSSILGEKGEVLARQTQRVKLKRSNKLGLYDMSGNVWEWCRDDAFGSKQKVVKGGAWLSKANECAIDHKNSKEVYAMHYAIGFRVIKNLD